MIARFFFAQVDLRVAVLAGLDVALEPLAVRVERVDVHRAEVGLVARRGDRHVDERVDQPVGLRQLAAEQVAGERRVLRGEPVDLAPGGRSACRRACARAARAARGARARSSAEQRLADLVEPRIPQQVPQPLGVGRVEQPERLERRRPRIARNGFSVRPAAASSAAEQRQVVGVREGELEVRALLEDRRPGHVLQGADDGRRQRGGGGGAGRRRGGAGSAGLARLGSGGTATGLAGAPSAGRA